MKEFKYKIIKKLFFSNVLSRSFVNRYINKKEGGQFYSKTLRRLYKDTINANIGIVSYGCFSFDFCYGQSFNVGNYCSIANGVSWIPGNHPIDDVSTHPFFHRKEYGYYSPNEQSDDTNNIRIIGHDV